MTSQDRMIIAVQPGELTASCSQGLAIFARTQKVSHLRKNKGKETIILTDESSLRFTKRNSMLMVL